MEPSFTLLFISGGCQTVSKSEAEAERLTEIIINSYNSKQTVSSYENTNQSINDLEKESSTGTTLSEK